MALSKVYHEIVDFFAQIDPRQILAFRPSAEAQHRLEDLLYREKNEGLSAEEKTELDNYMVLEHLMRLAKAKAYKLLH